jgi:indolepyruvate decarboxylase
LTVHNVDGARDVESPVPVPGDGHFTVADYLMDRLAGFGVGKIFGVPGDFTLGLLDHIEERSDIEWVGTANELGAGYAADGYARITGLGVVCTTFGVGELSALNAIAGSYAEHVPVLHLVGAPTVAVQNARRPTHHTLGDGDFNRTVRINAEVTVAQGVLTAANALTEIDRVLTAIKVTGQPGLLSLPADVAELPVDRPVGPLLIPSAASDPDALQRFTSAAQALIAQAHRPPTVLADVYVHRAGAESNLHALLSTGGLRYASLLWGRRVVDESGPGYLGTYVGAASEPQVRTAIENAELLITAGVFFTDLISGFFSQHIDETRRIDLLPHTALVAGTAFTDVEMSDALDVLATLITPGDPQPLDPVAHLLPPSQDAQGPLTQDQLWSTVAAALKPGDLVIADQGTSFYGMGRQRIPHNTVFIGQPLWASIGFTLPALVGAALAAPQRRPVLLIGDGAAQLTIQELGTLMRYQIPAIVVVVNNNGYTVERAIHGSDKRYNDIAPWRWTELPRALGGDEDFVQALRAFTATDIADAFAAADPNGLTLIEAVTDPLDVPTLLSAVAKAAAGANSTSTTV